jgi:phage terminase small subunit
MSEEEEFGPAMAALTEKQRGFVMAMIEFPGISFADAARRAGYSDTADGAKVRGHYAAHNPAVQAAVREEAGKRLNASSLMAANLLMQMLTDDAVEPKDRIKAAGMLLDRSGFGAAQTIHVNKTTTDRTGAGMMERIRALAAANGLDPVKLLGGNAAPVVDAEFAEVEPAGE